MISSLTFLACFKDAVFINMRISAYLENVALDKQETNKREISSERSSADQMPP